MVRKLVKLVIPSSLFRVVAPYGHLAEAVLAQLVYGFPAHKLQVVGVTGTDGKSTTSMLITQMLRASGKKTAMLTTIAVDYGDGKQRPSPKHMTTAGVWQLLKMIKRAKRTRAQWLVLETSSHALSQYRVWGIPFSVAVLTNISHEHLDYHKTMDRYARAKLRLFKLANRNRRGLRTGIINADDNFASQFTSAINRPLIYGINRGELRAKDIKLDSRGSSYTIEIAGKPVRIKCRLSGKFNVYNSLAAAGAGLAAGLYPSQISKGIYSLESIPGRMERVDTPAGFSVYVDYAVTPNALANALEAAREIAGQSRVLIVFGATGDRDKTKRPQMGKVASEGADKVFLTDDETYREDPVTIRAAVRRGIDTDKLVEIGDRKDAIAAALKAARAGDVVLITGLGHQNSRNMGGQDEAWNDQQVVKELLKK